MKNEHEDTIEMKSNASESENGMYGKSLSGSDVRSSRNGTVVIHGDDESDDDNDYQLSNGIGAQIEPVVSGGVVIGANGMCQCDTKVDFMLIR